MENRCCESLEEAKKSDFSGSAEKPSGYALNAISVLQQMHNALVKLLPPQQIGLIFQEAFNSIATSVENIYPTLNISNETAAKQLSFSKIKYY